MSDFGRLQELARSAGVQINPPTNDVLPVVTPETAIVGAVFTCTTGGWTYNPTTYAYQWLGVAATPAESANYTAVAGDVGNSLSCVVTATNDVGSATATSNAVTVAAAQTRVANYEGHADTAASRPARK